ncbi:PP2C family serine/threonine-protein phosphatase [Catenulispora rubra]|uniref:PP2C family serine/threonine-protein phosphatase n=1 Tax=Catenulispora rubra TaxID=280293 RepID=UPI001891FD28|nr:protein phosphatase 2C domain-containing protein [Catenulispora rubra]
MTVETTGAAGAAVITMTAEAGQEADHQMPLQLTCPNCGATDLVMEQGARFCEACGYGVDEPVTGEEEPSEFQDPKPCVSCGGTEIDAEGYCTDCGDLQPRRRDRMEVNLGVVAGISDRGLRHHRNEDSMALRPAVGLDGRNLVVAVVCDGVSTSERPDEASAAAVAAAAKLLLTAIAAGTPEPVAERVPEPAPAHVDPVETAVMQLQPEIETEPDGVAGAAGAAGAPVAIGPADLGLISRHAVADADRAVSDLARDADHGNPPACTYVSAIVGEEVTVAWLGDSRAYWLDERGTSRALTRDDAAEGSHAIEAWLGADSGAPEPHLARFTPDGPGVVLVCSDGLWNYVEKAADLAALALPAALTDPFDAAARLVRKALDSGGHDNITAVLVPYPVQAPAEGAGQTGASQQP